MFISKCPYYCTISIYEKILSEEKALFVVQCKCYTVSSLLMTLIMLCDSEASAVASISFSIDLPSL